MVVVALHLLHCTFVVHMSLPLCEECFSPQFFPQVGHPHLHPIIDLCWIDPPVLVYCSDFCILHSVSALLFCCPGIWINLSLNLVNHYNHLICLGPTCDFCMKVFSAS